MIASINTKDALVEIVKIKPINNKHDKIYFRDIQNYKREIKNGIKEGNDNLVGLYKAEIIEKRRLLKKHRDQVYVFAVYLRKYKSKHSIELSVQPEYNKKKVIKEAIDKALRAARSAFKHEALPTAFGKKWIFARLGTKEKGFVFQEEGSILKIHVQKNMKMLLDSKTPVAPRRYVGIEIEFCAPIKEEQLATKLFQKGIHKFAQLKHDGSLRPKEREYSYELALLLEEGSYKKNLKIVTSVLADVKAVAKDRRCGLHVHLDMRRRDKDLVYNNLVACQYALLSVVDPNRYNNEFCRVVTGRKFPTEFTGERVERYKTINAAAYYKFRTLEVRMHEGSVSFNEIRHWIDLLLKVANCSKYLKNDVTKLDVLKTRLKLKDKLYDYAIERSCSWQVQNNPNMVNMRDDIAGLQGRARMPHPGILYNHAVAAAPQQQMVNRLNGIFNVIAAEPEPEFAEGPDLGIDIDDDLVQDENGN